MLIAILSDGYMKGLSFQFVHFNGQFIMTQNSWNYSVQTTRQAFYLMLDKDSDSIADIFDLIFGELTIKQLESINSKIDAPIFKELFLTKHRGFLSQDLREKK